MHLEHKRNLNAKKIPFKCNLNAQSTFRIRKGNLAKPHYPGHNIKRKIDRSYKHVIPQFAELQYCNVGQSKYLRC